MGYYSYGKAFWADYHRTYEQFCACVNDDAYGLKYDYDTLRKKLDDMEYHWKQDHPGKNFGEELQKH